MLTLKLGRCTLLGGGSQGTSGSYAIRRLGSKHRGCDRLATSHVLEARLGQPLTHWHGNRLVETRAELHYEKPNLFLTGTQFLSLRQHSFLSHMAGKQPLATSIRLPVTASIYVQFSLNPATPQYTFCFIRRVGYIFFPHYICRSLAHQLVLKICCIINKTRVRTAKIFETLSSIIYGRSTTWLRLKWRIPPLITLGKLKYEHCLATVFRSSFIEHFSKIGFENKKFIVFATYLVFNENNFQEFKKLSF